MAEWSNFDYHDLILSDFLTDPESLSLSVGDWPTPESGVQSESRLDALTSYFLAFVTPLTFKDFCFLKF